MFEYICPDCDTKLKSKVQAEPGQEFECPRCQTVFTPRAEVIKFAAGDEPAKAKKTKPKAKAAPVPAAAPPPPPPKSRMDTDEEDDMVFAATIL